MSEAAAPSQPDGAAPGAARGGTGAGRAAVASTTLGTAEVAATTLGTAGPGTAATVTAVTTLGTAVLGTARLGTAELATWVSRLAGLVGAGDDAERVDQLRLLEEVKGACAAAQARVAVAFADSQLAAQDAAGVRARGAGEGDRRADRVGAPGLPAPRFPAAGPGPRPGGGDAAHPDGADPRTDE